MTLRDEITFLRGQLETTQAELVERSRELAQERERFDILYREALNRIPQHAVGTDIDVDVPMTTPVTPGRVENSDREQQRTPAPWWSPRSYARYTGRKRVLYGTAVDLLFSLPVIFLFVFGGLALDAVSRSTSGVFTWERLGQAAIVSTILALPFNVVFGWWTVRVQRRP